MADKLQRVLNVAARLVNDTKKFDRGLSHLLHTDLHWLHVPEPVQFKLCITVHRCMQDKAPQYLKEYCTSFSDRQTTIVFAHPAVTFFLCHVIVELLAVGPSLLLVRQRGTLYLTIYVIRRVSYFGRFLKSNFVLLLAHIAH